MSSMVNDRPSREEDNKVVMSKLPRDEFANFKKICDKENKTVNKKIRELINLEIHQNFARPMTMDGKRKRFFVPAENKLMEVIEIQDESSE